MKIETNNRQKARAGIQTDLIPERLGNVILGFEKGTSRESGFIVTKETQADHPDIWGRTPTKLQKTISEGAGSLFIDTVGNTTFQASYKIPEILTRHVAEGQVINITPLLTRSAAGNINETHAAD